VSRLTAKPRYLRPSELQIDQGNYTPTAIARVNYRVAEVDRGAIHLELVNFNPAHRVTVKGKKRLAAIFGTDDYDQWLGQLLNIGWDVFTADDGIQYPYFQYLPLREPLGAVPWDVDPIPLAMAEVQHHREKLELGLYDKPKESPTMPELATLGIDTGKHLKASDLQGREVDAVIQTAGVEKLGDDTKLVLGFVGKKKGMALNKGNLGILTENFGSNTDRWLGQTVTLYAVMTEYAGKPVQGLRLKVPAAAPQPAQNVTPPNMPDPGPGFDDDIPF